MRERRREKKIASVLKWKNKAVLRLSRCQQSCRMPSMGPGATYLACSNIWYRACANETSGLDSHSLHYDVGGVHQQFEDKTFARLCGQTPQVNAGLATTDLTLLIVPYNTRTQQDKTQKATGFHTRTGLIESPTEQYSLAPSIRPQRSVVLLGRATTKNDPTKVKRAVYQRSPPSRPRRAWPTPGVPAACCC